MRRKLETAVKCSIQIGVDLHALLRTYRKGDSDIMKRDEERWTKMIDDWENDPSSAPDPFAVEISSKGNLISFTSHSSLSQTGQWSRP